MHWTNFQRKMLRRFATWSSLVQSCSVMLRVVQSILIAVKNVQWTRLNFFFFENIEARCSVVLPLRLNIVQLCTRISNETDPKAACILSRRKCSPDNVQSFCHNQKCLLCPHTEQGEKCPVVLPGLKISFDICLEAMTFWPNQILEADQINQQDLKQEEERCKTARQIIFTKFDLCETYRWMSSKVDVIHLNNNNWSTDTKTLKSS